MLDRYMRLPEVKLSTGLSEPTIRRYERNGCFPSRRHITSNAVGWLASEVNAWLESRPRKHDPQSERGRTR
jgi:prophage regulatory protein